MVAIETILVRRILGHFVNQPIDLRYLKKDLETYGLIVDKLWDKYNTRYYSKIYKKCKDYNFDLIRFFKEDWVKK